LFASQRSFHCDKSAERFIIKADSKKKSECVILYSSDLLSFVVSSSLNVVAHIVNSVVHVDHLHIEEIIYLRDSRLIIERLYVEINTLKYLK